MITNQKYLYLGGRLDGTWRYPLTHDPVSDLPGYEQIHDDVTLERDLYVATKVGHVGPAGGFRMQLVIMLEQSLHSLILLASDDVDDETHNRARRMERALTMRAIREHLQLTWLPDADGLLDFGPNWTAMEQCP